MRTVHILLAVGLLLMIGCSKVTLAQCGPPSYACFTTSTANPGPISAYFSNASPQNATAYDTTLNPVGVGCIALATTATGGSNGQSMGGSFSGGANGHDWAWLEDMLAAGTVGGGWELYGVTTDARGCPQITNPGPGNTAWTGLGAVAFDWYTASGIANHTIYNLQQHHIIKTADVANVNSATALSTVFDYSALDACPGPVPNPVVGGSIFTPVQGAAGKLRFVQALSPGGQGTGTGVWVYDQTLGCTAVDLANGLYYPWCLANCSAEAGISLSTTGNYCYGFGTSDGIHDGQPTGDGTVIRISVNSAAGAFSTHGVCAGLIIGGTIAWTIGTGITTYTNGERTGGVTCPVANCDYDGHPSEGNSKAIGSGPNNFNIRSVSNYAGTFTIAAPKLQSFTGTGVPQDNHGAWPPGGNLLDAFTMWVGATDLILAANVSPCAPTSAVYCPPYLANVLFALPIDGSNARPRILVHTHSCNQPGVSFAACSDGPDDYFGSQESIPSVSPQGNYVSWTSTDLHSFGKDGSNKFRSNLLILRPGNTPVPFPPAPATGLFAIVSKNGAFDDETDAPLLFTSGSASSLRTSVGWVY